MTATATKPETVELAGTVQELYCQQPTFCAGKFQTPRSHTVKFKVRGYVKPGQQCTLRGTWTTHPKYGKQFDAAEVVIELPTSPAGVAQWIAWNVPGAGIVTGQKLVDEFGPDLMPLASQDPGQVAATCGVPIEVVNEIADQWQKHASRIAVQSRLAGFGLTQYQVEAIVSRFGSTAVTVLDENPYLLLGLVDGLGFKTIDEIALKTGMTRNDPRRVAAAIQWTVKQSVNDDGNTCITKAAAIERATEFLGFDVDGIAQTIEEHQGLVHIDAGGTAFLATQGCYANEAALWRYFAAGRQTNGYVNRLKDVDAGTVNINGDAVALDESQAAAVRLALAHRCTVITGGAGSGKTLTAKAIYQAFTRAGVPVTLVAPTGKAARRLKEVIGHEAATIHRTLGYNPDGGFGFSKDHPLPDGVYLVDESSMIDVPLMYHLVSALPASKKVRKGTWRDTGDGEEYGPPYVESESAGAVLVLIGDENQLPPVGPGAVLRDLLAHNLTPAARLAKCHRQAGVLKSSAAAILDGELMPSDMNGTPPAWAIHKSLNDADMVIRAITKLYGEHLKAWGFGSILDTQFMTAVHRGRLGTRHLNRVVQHLHQRSLGVEISPPDENDERRPPLYVGDKVIHTKNNYELNVMNGTVGVVTSTMPLAVEYDDGEIEYPDKFRGEVELAYVLTPHKMQGSEVPCAVVVCHKTNQYMQTRNWLYTGSTRAKKTCVIIGDEASIRRAAGRTDANRRTTLLSVFAQCEGARPQ